MMPKFQSEMLFASYLPVCSTTKDLPASDSSRTWLNNDQVQINGPGYNYLSSACNTSQLQDHEKEMIKKTMLEQDAEFKYQVSELHRVYGIQRELMNKARMKGLTTNNIEGNTSKSNPIMFEGLSKSIQTCQVPNFTVVDTSRHWPSSVVNFQVASSFDAGKSMQAATKTSIIGSSLKDNVFLPFSSKELGKRTFDLELPADEYIGREEERFEDGTVSGVSKAPDYAIKDLSAVCHQKDSKLSICKDQLNSSGGNLSGTNLIPSITTLADLNKTFQLNKEGTLYSTSLLPLDTSIMERSYSQKPNMVFQVQTKGIDCMQRGKDLEIRSEDLYMEKMSRKHEHTSSNYLMSSTIPFDTPASLSKNATLSIGNYCLNNNNFMSRNMTYDPRFASVGSLQNNLLHRLPAEHIGSSSMFVSHMSNLTNSRSQILNKGFYRKYNIDLNSSLNEDGSPPVGVETKSEADINLEPPVSPENKESSPPRGNSVEKQPAESVKLAEMDGKYQTYLAAEALVLISSDSAESLKWFAGVVISAANAEENNETVQGRVADSNHREHVAVGLSNFAALTPRLEETKFEEYHFSGTGNRKRIAAATSSSLPKRKRTRRTKSQKAMQGDILPHITSPLREEVSQETSTINGLLENEGKARLGKKKSSENERQKGKKHNSKSTLSHHPMCSYPKQQTAEAKLDSLERCVPGWGSRNKRQTGQRHAAPNYALRLPELGLEG